MTLIGLDRKRLMFAIRTLVDTGLLKVRLTMVYIDGLNWCRRQPCTSLETAGNPSTYDDWRWKILSGKVASSILN